VAAGMEGTERPLGTIKRLHRLNSISSLIPFHFRNATASFPSLRDEELLEWGFRTYAPGNRPYYVHIIEKPRLGVCNPVASSAE